MQENALFVQFYCSVHVEEIKSERLWCSLSFLVVILCIFHAKLHPKTWRNCDMLTGTLKKLLLSTFKITIKKQQHYLCLQ